MMSDEPEFCDDCGCFELQHRNEVCFLCGATDCDYDRKI
jgi:hypothetical protein